VARTIYLGSAPIQNVSNRGIDDRRIKLGCAQPGEVVATFGDALRRLADRATYLYVDGNRYWYSTQPTVNRLADDRARQFQKEDVEAEIVRRLRQAARSRGDFYGVHVCPSSGDVPDERECRLVLLGPEYSHARNEVNSSAKQEAQRILDFRGASPRDFKNSLVFLAADSSKRTDLETAVRQYLAWQSICSEKEPLNLDAFQSRQAETKCREADDTVEVRIPETYQWLLIPSQPDPKGPVHWTEVRQQGAEPLAVRAGRKLKNDGLLLTQMGGVTLRIELDKIPLWRGNHVLIQQLIDDFAKYLYLPRLKDSDVLIAAIREGVSQITWQSDTFAYAEGYDEQKKRYRGLIAGRAIQVLPDGHGMLVKPDVAAVQFELEGRRAPDLTAGKPSAGTAVQSGDSDDRSRKTGPFAVQSAAPIYRRFYGSVRLDSFRVARDAGKIAEEVIRHFSALQGAQVEVTMEIQAVLEEGIPEKTVRDVAENCRALKFETYGFEES
jgi:hypothetical protein